MHFLRELRIPASAGGAYSAPQTDEFEGPLCGKERSKEKLQNSRNIDTETKMRLWKAPVWPVETHGYETWTLKKAGEDRISARNERTEANNKSLEQKRKQLMNGH